MIKVFTESQISVYDPDEFINKVKENAASK